MKFENRIAQEHISKLEKNEVFVFGSNRLGKHGKGAALTAKRKFGAREGKGEGHYGKSYGIPTKSRPTRQKRDILSLEEIEYYVDRFIRYAQKKPNLIFKVTKIGCGLSRYSAAKIGPLFQGAVEIENIHLPVDFWTYLSPC